MYNLVVLISSELILELNLGLPGGSVVKNLPASAGDTGLIPESGRAPEKELATHSYNHAWRIPWTEKPGRLQSMGFQRLTQDLATK